MLDIPILIGIVRVSYQHLSEQWAEQTEAHHGLTSPCAWSATGTSFTVNAAASAQSST